MSKNSETPPPGGQFLVYQTQDGKLKIDVRFEGETVWLTQQNMTELFQTTKQNVGPHLKSIFTEGELFQDSVVKDSFTTAAEEMSTQSAQASPVNATTTLRRGRSRVRKWRRRVRRVEHGESM
jgi:hypothetical protein